MLESRKNRFVPVNIRRFSSIVWGYYKKSARVLPWRKTNNPYHVLVSEVMLQQTQVSRVVDYFQRFLKKFPTVQDLAKANLAEVLIVWQGLGYNRRAKYLWQSARIIVDVYKGVIPNNVQALDELPGIGSDTAGAICAYAFNQPVVFVETNIRTVFIRHFFLNQKKVSDEEIRIFVLQSLDQKKPREWYSALMDYGAFLKKTNGNYTKRSVTYTKQKPFTGSVRQVRGFILKEVLQKRRVEKKMVVNLFGEIRAEKAIEGLIYDGLIVESRGFLMSI